MTAVHEPVALQPDTGARPRTLTSIIICSVGRSAGLSAAVRSVLDQDWPELELILVDNSPGSGNTSTVAAQFNDRRLHYVVEPLRGLSRARNRGVTESTGDIIMFTDDDCVADPGWVRSVRAVFDQHPTIACVTGRTIPHGDMTPVQQTFEDFGSFNRGTVRTVWRFSEDDEPELPAELRALGEPGEQTRIFPYTGAFGSGNNMAFASRVLRELGPFDEALGAGSRSAGGEDLDMFIRLVLAGNVLIYEPAAEIRHTHRETSAALAAQVRSYGSGLSAMITKQLVSDAAGRRRIVRRALPGLRHLLSASSDKNSRKSANYPRKLTMLELRGVLEGPWLYLRSRWVARRHPAVRPAGQSTAPAERER